MGCNTSKFEGYGISIDQADQNLRKDMKGECFDVRFYYFDGQQRARYRIDNITYETVIQYRWDGQYWYASIL